MRPEHVRGYRRSEVTPEFLLVRTMYPSTKGCYIPEKGEIKRTDSGHRPCVSRGRSQSYFRAVVHCGSWFRQGGTGLYLEKRMLRDMR
jgi:hypothetical protein